MILGSLKRTGVFWMRFQTQKMCQRLICGKQSKDLSILKRMNAHRQQNYPNQMDRMTKMDFMVSLTHSSSSFSELCSIVWINLAFGYFSIYF